MKNIIWADTKQLPGVSKQIRPEKHDRLAAMKTWKQVRGQYASTPFTQKWEDTRTPCRQWDRDTRVWVSGRTKSKTPGMRHRPPRERDRERSQDGRWTNVYLSIKDALRLLSELLLFHNIMQHCTCLTQQKNEHSIHYTVCYGCKYQLLKIITWLFLVLLCLRVVYCKWYPKCSFFNVQLSKVNEFPLANWAIWSSVTTITNK